MAGKRTANIEFFQIAGEPSLRHRIFFDIYPFWQGSTQRFRLIMEAKKDIEHKSTFLYTVEYAYGDQYPEQQLSIAPIKAKEKRVYNLVPIPLLYTGDSFLKVTELLDSKNNVRSGYETVYSFHVTNRSWLWLTILAGLLAGLFSALGNLLFSIIN